MKNHGLNKKVKLELIHIYDIRNDLFYVLFLVFCFVQKIRSYLVSELHRFENEISEQLTALKNDLELRQMKPARILTAKLV